MLKDSDPDPIWGENSRSGSKYNVYVDKQHCSPYADPIFLSDPDQLCLNQGRGSGSAFIFSIGSGSAFCVQIRFQKGKFSSKNRKMQGNL